jgi:putative transposase
MAKYQNKYRIESARAQWWDYGWNGAYFITICTQNMEHFFGKIVNKKMILSPTGVIADILWHEIPNHSSFVELGDFVVMPNHIHGILILNKPDGGGGHDDGDGGGHGHAQTLHATSLQPNQQPPPQPNQQPPPQPNQQPPPQPNQQPPPQPNQQPPPQPDRQQPPKNEKMAGISPKSGSVSAILRSYKSAVTKHANRLELPNGWHVRFHDHIIRDDAEYQRISNYIITNPENWDKDKFNSDK